MTKQNNKTMNKIQTKMIDLKINFYKTFEYDEDIHSDLMERMDKVLEKARNNDVPTDDIISLQEAYIF